MNGEQFAYQVGRLVKGNYDSFCLSLAAVSGMQSYLCFSNAAVKSDYRIIMAGTALGALAGTSALCSYYGGISRVVSLKESGKINRNASDYPLEHAEKIIIEDKDGLDFLLNKTRKSERAEWGTLLRAMDDKGVAVIYDVLDIEKGKAEGLIKKGKRNRMDLDIFRARDEGYSGCHHYHRDMGPDWFGARNYAIDLHDRVKPENWINLLTFNMPDGPEIIGFNRKNVYIPIGKSKDELFRATPREINAHLSIRSDLLV